MNRICLIVFIFFYNTVTAQVTLQGNSFSTSISAFDSIGAEATAITSITMDRAEVIVLSASDTGLKYSSDSTSINKKTCVISFIGCDESHTIMSDFTSYFYTEYLKTSNKESAFFKARAYLFNKYPDSPVTPVLSCSK